MPFLIALALYGGVFVGYVVTDTKVLKPIAEEASPDMLKLRAESEQMINEAKQ